jgi:lipopolysaccharide/colanic/teichoic acid biosynthesis glycosyltransferase
MHQAGMSDQVGPSPRTEPAPAERAAPGRRPSSPALVRALVGDDEGEPDALQRRLFDIGIATIGLVVFSPLLALIALLVKLESPGPVLFRQKRVGKGGRLFEVYKFRSMRVARPEEQTVPDVGEIETFRFRPPGFGRRVTEIGRVLRACSLDEMPQLLNVLKGDMHLVGPRPDEPEIVAAYRPEYHARFKVKPGITGLAQVNGRTDLTYQEIMAYDLDYVREHPFARDIRIMLKSLRVVLRREGAR